MKTLTELRFYIETSWSYETTWMPETYEGRDPAWGQCGVTALYLHDMFGGLILSGIAELPSGTEVRHFWNQINFVDVDLTARQFPIGTRIRHVKVTTRAALLEHSMGAWFQARYNLFLDRVTALQEPSHSQDS